MWSHSFHSASTLAGSRCLRALSRSAKWSRNGLKSSYSMTNSRPFCGLGVVEGDAAGHLQPHGRFAGALFAEDDRRGRVGRVAVDLVPGRMIRGVAAALLEDGIRLRILLRKRIDGDAVVLEQLLNAHGDLGG